MTRPRVRECGLVVGELPTGPRNALTDVAGVRVGHATLIEGEGALIPGRGPVRTGVTVILPAQRGDNLFRHKVHAAVHTINGYGKPFGFEQVRELGVIESPIALTNTLNVGRVADALVQYSLRQNPEIGITASSVNVVVGETNDGWLNDIQGRHVGVEHVFAAIESAAEIVAEGAVGAGTGTVCFGWKGGIGMASRMIPADAGARSVTLGALVQSNFGRAQDLVICGVPVGKTVRPDRSPRPVRSDAGSIMIVLATNAPLDSRQLRRLCVRASAGLARVGSHFSHGSGDFVIAFSTANRIEHEPASLTTTRTVLADEPKVMDGLFRAVVECVEEAVLNSLFCTEMMVGRDGHTAYALPAKETIGLVTHWHDRGPPTAASR